MLRTALLTLIAITAGIWIGGVEVKGKTLAGYVRSWTSSTKLPKQTWDGVKSNVSDAVDGARDLLHSGDKPSERHSEQDRRAVDQLIARKQSPANASAH